MKNYIIAIPTYKRSDILIKRVGPLQIIPADMMNNTYLFVREEELEAYLPVAEHFGCGVLPVFIDPDAGIPETRDAILEHCIGKGIEYLIMMDDDLKLAVHDLTKTKANYYTMDESMFKLMILDLLHYTDESNILTGITARQFSNVRTTTLTRNNRIIQLYCMHMPTIAAQGFHFTYGAPFITDYYFVLSMLVKGYTNIILNEYTRDDKANAPGGCSEMRTVENQNKSAVMLYKQFPEVVRLVQKNNGTWTEPRINPIVSWKKAYLIGQERNKEIKK